MIVDLQGTIMKIICNNCSNEISKDYKEFEPLKWLEQFNHNENIGVECEKCGANELFNMNLPKEEETALEDMPENEQIQRQYVKRIAANIEKEPAPEEAAE